MSKTLKARNALKKRKDLIQILKYYKTTQLDSATISIKIQGDVVHFVNFWGAVIICAAKVGQSPGTV